MEVTISELVVKGFHERNPTKKISKNFILHLFHGHLKLPQQQVDFEIRSKNQLLRSFFGKSLDLHRAIWLLLGSIPKEISLKTYLVMW